MTELTFFEIKERESLPQYSGMKYVPVHETLMLQSELKEVLKQKAQIEKNYKKAQKDIQVMLDTDFVQELKEARETISVDNLVNVFSKVLKGNGKYMVDFGSEDDSNNFILDLVNEFRKVLNKQDKEEAERKCPHCGSKKVEAWGEDADRCMDCELSWSV